MIFLKLHLFVYMRLSVEVKNNGAFCHSQVTFILFWSVLLFLKLHYNISKKKHYLPWYVQKEVLNSQNLETF